MYYINFKYKNIKGFGLTGYNAFHDFKHIHCSSNRIFPFLYVTMPFDLEESNQDITTQSIRITFVGAIDERKNIKRIISFINRNKKSIAFDYQLDIYGGYGDVNALQKCIDNNPFIIYHGIVSNEEVRKAMNESDIVLLPSVYDGWGATINEALQCGCRVLVSTKCGSASMPLKYPFLGEVFNPNSEIDFISKFSLLLSKGKLQISERNKIKQWSKIHIHPDVVAKYLINIIDSKETGSSLPKNLFY